MIYIFIAIIGLAGFSMYYFLQHIKKRQLLRDSELISPKNFFKLLKFEVDSLAHIPAYVRKVNFSIDEVFVPALNYKSEFDSIETAKANEKISNYFDKKNLERGINSMSLNQIPYFTKMSKGLDVSAMGNFVSSEIPELRHVVSKIIPACQIEDSQHKRFFKFWLLLCQNLKKLDIKVQEKFKKFCQRCSGTLRNLNHFNSPSDLDKHYANQHENYFKDFNFNNFSFEDIVDIGLMTGLSYFVLDLDNIDVIAGSILDDVLSGEMVQALEDTVDAVATVGIPIISVWRESKKQNRLRAQGLTTSGESWKYGGVTVGSKAAGALGGGKIGVFIGSLILPGPGSVIGGLIGSFFGSIGGMFVSSKWKIKRWKNAAELLNEMNDSLQKSLKKGNYSGTFFE